MLLFAAVWCLMELANPSRALSYLATKGSLLRPTSAYPLTLGFDWIDMIYYFKLSTIGTMPFLLVGVIQK